MTWLSEMRIILMPGCAFQTQQRAKLALLLTFSHTLDRHCTDGVHGGTNRTLNISPSFASQIRVKSGRTQSQKYHILRSLRTYSFLNLCLAYPCTTGCPLHKALLVLVLTLSRTLVVPIVWMAYCTWWYKSDFDFT